MKMELIEGSETSAIILVTPGNYPKENVLHTEHGESLKSRIILNCVLLSFSTWMFVILYFTKASIVVFLVSLLVLCMICKHFAAITPFVYFFLSSPILSLIFFFI